MLRRVPYPSSPNNTGPAIRYIYRNISHGAIKHKNLPFSYPGLDQVLCLMKLLEHRTYFAFSAEIHLDTHTHTTPGRYLQRMVDLHVSSIWRVRNTIFSASALGHTSRLPSTRIIPSRISIESLSKRTI